MYLVKLYLLLSFELNFVNFLKFLSINFINIAKRNSPNFGQFV